MFKLCFFAFLAFCGACLASCGISAVRGGLPVSGWAWIVIFFVFLIGLYKVKLHRKKWEAGNGAHVANRSSIDVPLKF